MQSLIGDSPPNNERWFSYSETCGRADGNMLGIAAGQPESTIGQFVAFAKDFVLLACQQIAVPGSHNNEPVIQWGAVISDKFHAPCFKIVCPGLGERRKRIYDISVCVERALVRKSLPSETTVSKFDGVALVSDARRFVNALVVRARDKQQRQDNQNCTKNSHARDAPANWC